MNSDPIDLDRLLEPLTGIARPGRYIGGEVNQVRKDLAACDVRIALCFPDTYEIGMSHTGLAILYDVLNRMEAWNVPRSSLVTVMRSMLASSAVMRDMVRSWVMGRGVSTS